MSMGDWVLLLLSIVSSTVVSKQATLSASKFSS